MNLSESYKKRLKNLSGIISEGIYDIQELNTGEVNIPEQYIKDTLNPKVWEGEKLIPEIREHLLHIAKEYVKYLTIDAQPEKILFLGSMANFNWNESSDFDLHLVFDFSKVDNDVKLAKEFFDTKGSNWKANHKITIKGYDVEVYVQEKSEANKSVGVFDLINNDWITKPHKENVTIDRELIKKKAASVATQIEHVEKLFKDGKDLSKVYKCAKKIKDKIKKMRQSGLDKSGEFSAENLAFKYLRNNGFLERLGDVSSKSFDKELSINEMKALKEEAKYNPWAVCHSSTGPKKTKKFEKCVKAVKKKENIEEGEEVPKVKNKLIIKKSVDNFDEEKINLTKKFIAFCCKELEITEPCIVYLTGERGGPITTTASYNPSNDYIWIYTKNRNMLGDVLRSLAHEIRHFRQKLDGVLHNKSGEDGSEHENEANSFSGEMIRKFGRANREIYK